MKKIINAMLTTGMLCAFLWFVVFTPKSELMLLVSMFVCFATFGTWILFSKAGRKILKELCDI